MKFVNGTLELDEDYVIIKRKGVMSFMSQGLKGDKRIPYENITAVQFKTANWVTNGYIQFSMLGAIDSKAGIMNATKDENTIMFTKGQQKDMENLKAKIEAKIKELKNKNSNTVVQEVSGADEILKFKELMDQGIISNEQFELKKNEILGL